MTILPEPVRNAWHLVALSRSVSRKRPLGVLVAGMPVARARL